MCHWPLGQVGPGYPGNRIPGYLDNRIPGYQDIWVDRHLDTWYLTGRARIGPGHVWKQTKYSLRSKRVWIWVVCKTVLANGRDWILENLVARSQQYAPDPVKGDKSRPAFKLGPEFKFALTANGDQGGEQEVGWRSPGNF